MPSADFLDLIVEKFPARGEIKSDLEIEFFEGLRKTGGKESKGYVHYLWFEIYPFDHFVQGLQMVLEAIGDVREGTKMGHLKRSVVMVLDSLSKMRSKSRLSLLGKIFGRDVRLDNPEEVKGKGIGEFISDKRGLFARVLAELPSKRFVPMTTDEREADLDGYFSWVRNADLGGAVVKEVFIGGSNPDGEEGKYYVEIKALVNILSKEYDEKEGGYYVLKVNFLIEIDAKKTSIDGVPREVDGELRVSARAPATLKYFYTSLKRSWYLLDHVLEKRTEGDEEERSLIFLAESRSGVFLYSDTSLHPEIEIIEVESSSNPIEEVLQETRKHYPGGSELEELLPFSHEYYLQVIRSYEKVIEESISVSSGCLQGKKVYLLVEPDKLDYARLAVGALEHARERVAEFGGKEEKRGLLKEAINIVKRLVMEKLGMPKVPVISATRVSIDYNSRRRRTIPERRVFTYLTASYRLDGKVEVVKEKVLGLSKKLSYIAEDKERDQYSTEISLNVL